MSNFPQKCVADIVVQGVTSSSSPSMAHYHPVCLWKERQGTSWKLVTSLLLRSYWSALSQTAPSKTARKVEKQSIYSGQSCAQIHSRTLTTTQKMNNNGEGMQLQLAFLLYSYVYRIVQGLKGDTYILKLYFTVIHVKDYMVLCYLRIETMLKSSGIF